MGKEFLSQEEVDALLKGVTGESDAAPEPEPDGSARPYNLGKQERIVRELLAVLAVPPLLASARA